ncbi:MAG: endonuclease III [Clostridia bacterium]|nr:endonuclease III [Clostridia bacterium]
MKTNKEHIEIIEQLKKVYPDAKCSLDFTTPFELGISVMLSAQCTDARVNIVTSSLFKKYNTPIDFVNIDLDELEKLIFPCGFYKVKAKNIKAYAEKILNEFNGELPSDIDKLMTLPGIGRKSANVIMLEAFNNPLGIAVDTHAKRISNRLGLSSEKDPLKIEQDLLKLYPKKYYKDINHLLVWHGRNTCTARNPKCDLCPLSSFCSFYIDKQNI